MKNETKLFSTENLVYAIKELIKIWSNKPSFFSKKRIESSIAFIIGQIGMIVYLIAAMKDMGTWDIMGWATIEFGIAGYIVTHIQKEKKELPNVDTPTKDEPEV
jgi:hypothetical protein